MPDAVVVTRVAEIVQPGFQLTGLQETQEPFGEEDFFRVLVGIPDEGNTHIAVQQWVRAGSAGLTATIVSSDPTVGQLITQTLIGGTVTVPITEGQLESPPDLLSGGVTLQPGPVGTTTVSVTIPGFIATAASVQEVIVDDPTDVTTPVPGLSLAQNQPNPFNPTTRIAFTLPDESHANLSVFDARGRLVTTLIDQWMRSGAADVIWDGRDARGTPVSSGVYFYRLTTDSRSLTRKMVMVK
jgi:hypothetical protein